MADSSNPNQRARFRSMMSEFQDMVLVFLSAQINELFASTDEALLDFAEKAQNSLMQGRFFEAMGAVRRHRTEVEQCFRREIQTGFGEFGKTPAVPAENNHGIEMSLIEPDDMEESVAEENLILRSRNKYYAELYALSQRLAVVNGGRKVADDDIPAGPAHLVGSFRAALLEMDIDVKAKIVMYALFDKFVMRQLQGLYDEINGNLKQAGILPNLKPAYLRSQSPGQPGQAREADEPDSEPLDPSSAQLDADSGLGAHSGLRPPSSPSGDARAGAETPARGSLGEELFDSILELMSSRRGRAASPSQGAATPYDGMGAAGSGDAPAAATPPSRPSAGGRGASPAAAAARKNLMTAIDSIRPTSLGDSGGVLSDPEKLPQIAVDPGFIDSLKHTLSNERERILAQVDREQMPGIDADTIDLIGMLFEYMLNDPLLPNVAKALLSHLHTPYLKLALVERQLLVDSEHPARLLLDMLVDAGGQWVYENDIKRGIFPHMQSVVDRVLQEFTDNEGLFEELLEYFRAAMDEQRRKADAIESRAKESVQGREKLHVAKKRAAQEMHQRVDGANLPKSAARFLTQAWSDRLVFILLRHADGEQSRDWERSLQVADKLVWLFDAESAAADEPAVVAAADWIREEIDSALDSLGGYHQHYLEELLQILRAPVEARERHRRQEPPPRRERALTLDADAIGVDEDTTPREQDSMAKQARHAAAGLSSQPLLFDDAPGPSAELSAAEKDMLEHLQKLKFGTWFEFKTQNQLARRLKLSWLSPLTSTCMFVDRAGAQAEVKSLTEIARMLVDGRAKVIPRPKHQFVERAMLAIKKTLQRSMENT